MDNINLMNMQGNISIKNMNRFCMMDNINMNINNYKNMNNNANMINNSNMNMMNNNNMNINDKINEEKDINILIDNFNEEKNIEKLGVKSDNTSDEKATKILNVKSNDINKNNDNKYNELLNQLNEEKIKNKKLLEELSKEKANIKELNDKIKIYENSNNNNLKIIKELEKQLNSKNSEINNLKEYIYKNKIPSIKPGEEIIAICFTSIHEDIHRPILCKKTDTFAKIEEKIYDEYPIYKNFKTYLTVNGYEINRSKTLEENGIKDCNTIIINIYNE